MMLILEAGEIEFAPRSIERLLETAQISGAGMVYADRWHRDGRKSSLYSVNDYHPGSLRDTFDFGPVQLFSISAVRNAVIKRHGLIASLQHAGLYDLRLKLSEVASLFHIPEPLFTIQKAKKNLFDYVDPSREVVEKEMETVATAHLRRINAWLGPPFRKAPLRRGKFPVEASVIIPVRNRVATIADALQSALSQKVNFPFNVIAVDNHSSDGTTKVIAKLARYRNVVHIIPGRTDLGIGGCWNEAVYSEHCGRFAMQLDSDDLFEVPDALQRMVDRLRQSRYAMVIGAYTLINERFEKISPGLVAHKEWTDDNGPNNALRVNGLGAPRAFDTAVLRTIGFPNVSYGEDYAVALRISREFAIGRIYESIYLCRRWSGNTDACLSMEQSNRNDAYKDTIRTLEILARQKKNRGKRL
jgi:GT2 family glycosyltransferase